MDNDETVTKPGRPLKEGFNYLQHDVDASSDEKIEAIEIMFGDRGYAWYFKILERMYRNGNGMIELSSATNRKVLIERKLRTTEEEFEKYMQEAVGIGLFDKEKYEKDKIIYSEGVMKRRESMMKHRERARKWYATKKADNDKQNDKINKSKEDYSSAITEE